MTTALHRRLHSLHRLATQPATPEHEAAAAKAALGRLLARLGDDRERLTEREPPYVAPPQKRTGRRRARPHSERLAMGDVISCSLGDHPLWSRCRCGGDRFEIAPGVGAHPAQLVCVSCKRGGRWLRREHFAPGGRSLCS
jgi:hypothetical protein